ncbi:hypothetical protein EYF80_009059 [Liparis tanakae]|uniref:Uncharacterized protein n=1 Tax=Liparis tanakae TaxID=230148 RepID=A0A4Z2ISY2_9TELE|nr:hypothetical protein EYF80_009059 [Liparis tanakae]
MLPSAPQARARGASSLLPSACPLQLGQEMLRRRDLQWRLKFIPGDVLLPMDHQAFCRYTLGPLGQICNL